MRPTQMVLFRRQISMCHIIMEVAAVSNGLDAELAIRMKILARVRFQSVDTLSKVRDLK